MDHTYADMRLHRLDLTPKNQCCRLHLARDETLTRDSQLLGVRNRSQNWMGCHSHSQMIVTEEARVISYILWQWNPEICVPPGGQLVYEARAGILPKTGPGREPLLRTGETLHLTVSLPVREPNGEYLFTDNLQFACQVPADGIIREKYCLALYLLPRFIVLPRAFQ
jgi:hypothetical protein